MTLSIAFWVLFIIYAIYGSWSNWPVRVANQPTLVYRPLGGYFLHLLLLFVIGWQVFGAPIHK